MRKLWTRFKAGLEWIVGVGGKFYGAYQAVKAAAPKVAAMIKTTAGKACAYLTTNGFPSLSSPFCALQSANLYVTAVVGIVVVGTLVAYGVGTMIS